MLANDKNVIENMKKFALKFKIFTARASLPYENLHRTEKLFS